MFPPPFHNNLHLIKHTKLALLPCQSLLIPHHNPLLHIPFPPPRHRDPPAQSVRPERLVDLECRQVCLARVNSFVCRALISNFNKGIEQDRIRSRYNIISVNCAAFEREMRRGSAAIYIRLLFCGGSGACSVACYWRYIVTAQSESQMKKSGSRKRSVEERGSHLKISEEVLYLDIRKHM
jgi:hypothetical protein